MTRASQASPMGTQQEKTEQGGIDRSPAQFFFETGFFAAYAEACVEIGKAPFALSDRIVERAWEVAGDAHDDRAEFDAYLARANGSAPNTPPASNDFVLVPREKDRVGDWMQIASGRQFWPFDPRAEEVDIEDIAHALSQLCRFGGHTLRFYSVAEHSVLISYVVPPEDAFAALMHDATEAYCVDIPRPLKRGLSNYADVEAGIWRAICVRFGIEPVLSAAVKAADNAMCIAEARSIMSRPEVDWSAGADAADIEPRCWSPEVARAAFLGRFYELTEGRAFELPAALAAAHASPEPASYEAPGRGGVWQPIETAEMWGVYVVTDGENVAISQKAPADYGGHYWAVDPEDALEWEPTHCTPLPAAPSSEELA